MTDRDSIPNAGDASLDHEAERGADRAHDEPNAAPGENPPRTTEGHVTAPKFGSATSGGGELEPAPGT